MSDREPPGVEPYGTADEVLSAGTALIQPIALVWLPPTPTTRISEMPTGAYRCLQVSHRGLWKPNDSGSGCLASEGYKDVYISPSR